MITNEHGMSGKQTMKNYDYQRPKRKKKKKRMSTANDSKLYNVTYFEWEKCLFCSWSAV